MHSLKPRPSSLGHDDFLDAYGGIYETSAWVAEAVWPQAEAGALDSPGAMFSAMRAAVDAADDETRLALIKAHPDLAGRAAAAGALTGASKDEQSGAGLDRLTPQQATQFHALNHIYKAKFGFPFIIAVRGLDAAQILERFEARIENDAATEFAAAMTEIHTIAHLRLEAMCAEAKT